MVIGYVGCIGHFLVQRALHLRGSQDFGKTLLRTTRNWNYTYFKVVNSSTFWVVAYLGQFFVCVGGWLPVEERPIQHQRIYNSHYGNGAPAMFTSQYYLKLKGKHCQRKHCHNGVVDHLGAVKDLLLQMDGIETKCFFPKYHQQGCLGISKVIKISLPNLNDMDFRL